MQPEQRKQIRRQPNGNAFAGVGRNYVRVGKIKDISSTGLAFEYISGEKADQDSSEIDIFLVGDVFHLYNLPCNIVYDVMLPVPFVNSESAKSSGNRRCGVQFEPLVGDDKSQLQYFLDTHTFPLTPFISHPDLSG
jgi:hypothetical protein